MLFTRTIRRTFFFGMMLVVVMLLTLAGGGIGSLNTNNAIVAELSDSFEDRITREELASAVTELNLTLPGLTGEQGRTESQRDQIGKQARKRFDDQLAIIEKQLNDYKKRIDILPSDPSRNAARQVTIAALLDTFAVVADLGEQSRRLEKEPLLRAATFNEILREVDDLQLMIENLPEFTTGIQDAFLHAKSAYRRGMWLLGVSSAVVLVGFIVLVAYGRRYVLKPLHTLHQGAMRVAQGDFDYRVKLPAPEEMSDLADAFNCMTDNFQEIRDDLDQQVRDRFKQLVRSERLAGIGFLSAGVAHEINNPMQAIAFAAESLETRLIEPRTEEEKQNVEVMRQYLGMIQREAFRCQQITRKLLEFSRGNNEARSRHDLTAIINEVLALIRPMTKYHDRNIEFDRKTPCPIDANGPEIQQVVLNFVANALEAMESGGTLTISITEHAGQVVLMFRDDGCGMTQDVIENLFEPFFTQRKDGKGTGLGLSISHRIISAHGGTIDAKSEGPGKGSCFRVILPRNSFRAGTAA